MIQIVEVIHRSSQGVTRPFVCRADDDEIYYVKGSGAGRRSQICEWIAGRLGETLGLPIPDFDPTNFQRLHVFKGQIPALFGDLVSRAEYARRLELALERWGAILAEIPPEWHFQDAEMTVPTQFDASAELELLTRCMDKEFWTLP